MAFEKLSTFYRVMLLLRHLSMTLSYCDQIGWNTSKIISQLFRLGCLLFADPNIMDLL